MTPVASWTEESYYLASRAARRAWDNSQPQYVIDGLDAMLAAGDEGGVVAENRPTGGRAQRPVDGHSRTPAELSSPAASTGLDDAPLTALEVGVQEAGRTGRIVEPACREPHTSPGAGSTPTKEEPS